jgi:alanine racemase
MHRLGIAPENYVSAYKYLSSLPQIEQITLMSHFACADELENPMTTQQLQLFQETISEIDASTSLANSPFILGWPVPSGDIIRPGLMLYGASPFHKPHPNATQLETAMSLSTEVIAIRDITSGSSVGYSNKWTAERPSRIGTIALGYGDGYPRHAPSGTPVFIQGGQIPIVGRVSMDLVTVDLTKQPNTKIGTEVEVFGQNLSINEIASWCDTIPHTLMTGLTSRVPRHYA